MRIIHLFLFIIIIFTLNLYSQDIYSIQAMELFNEGNYSEAISLFKEYAEDHKSQRGKAYYFIGESFYNLSFSERLSNQSVLDYINQASDFFGQAAQQLDLENSQYNPQYKKAWCMFRSAELSSNPISYLINSATEFNKVTKSANNRIYNNSIFMVGESYLRLVKNLMWRPEPSWDNIINFLNSSENLFDNIITNPDVSEKRRIIAKIRKNDVLLEKVKINTLQNNVENSINILNNINYRRILSGVDHQLENQFKSIINYSEIYKLFYQLLLNPSTQVRNNMISSLENLSNFSGEKYFMNSLTDYIYEGSNKLNNLSNVNTTNYLYATQIIPDAWYWLGWLQFLNNNSSAVESFNQYLVNTDVLIKDFRINFLRESAYYRMLLMKFDNNVSNNNILTEINNNLENFNPTNSLIEREKNSLHSLVRICLGHNIDNIVQSRGIQISFNERIKRVINLVQKMLERATKVVGRERVVYLNHIHVLLQYLNNLQEHIENPSPELNEQIIFYNGLSLFLKAEIQPSQDLKREFYIDAAAELANLNELVSRYQNEGNYIRARSFFEAARNSSSSSQQNNLFNDAKEIFITLINDNHSLRSTYYLSEIFRLRQNFAAAFQCYTHIKEEVGEKEKNNFWYVNADAGLDRTNNFKDTGNLDVLNKVNISDIKYPENLLVVNDKVISMERFADSDFLKQEYFKISIEYYKKYGLPKKSFYPSVNSYKNSIFTASTYNINVGIQERIGELFSDFIVEIICPENIVYKPSVLLDSLALQTVEGYIFSQDSIKLNTSHILSIKNSNCYPYYRRILFLKPGIKELRIRLQPVLSCMSSQLSINEIKSNEQIDIIDLRERNDWNILFIDNFENNRGIILDDFQNNLIYRDVCFSNFHNAFFAVRNDTTYLLKYQNNNRTKFNLNIVKENIEIFYPEGITVDANGNFYIVNWAKHQVIILDSNGNFIKTFGEFGKNNKIGYPVKLTYPTRITISENTDNKTSYMLLYIADRYGIKIVDDNGNYLDSIINAQKGDEAVYYDLFTQGYGNNSVLYVVNRKIRKIEKYTLTEQY